MGFFGAGNFGIVPGYLTERFPTVARAVGAGFAYTSAPGLGSFTPTLVGMLQDRGLAAADGDGRLHRRVPGAMVILMLCARPETRGRQFHATD